MQRSTKCVSNSNKTAFNVDAPGCLCLGLLLLQFLFAEKSPESLQAEN